MVRFICLRPLMGALALALLFATPSMLAAEEPRRGGTAIVVIGADPAILNPNVTVGAPDVLTGCMLYDGLVRYYDLHESRWKGRLVRLLVSGSRHRAAKSAAGAR